MRQLQHLEAPRYDKHIAFFERILFADGREWVCLQAHGDVLELAAGTARNLPYYPSLADTSFCFEQVRSPLLPVRLLQRLLQPPAVRCAADHLTREPLDYLAAEGFVIERLERSNSGSSSVSALASLADTP